MSALTEAEISALREALDDEYKALATYDQVILDFGPVRPFINIREAEARHINALTLLFARYGVPQPPNPWPSRVTRYATLRKACEAGVRAEIENTKLYDRLIAAARHADLRRIFCRLQEASRKRHLPAFRRCLAREASTPPSTGPMRRRTCRRAGMTRQIREEQKNGT